ncbi:hypothetical protein MKZ38_000060 [Zalerion maritima]|uniref:Uncharacterized protein n=1 Tax=Zalerion maritima TaxID=339359 RepID=A0AAD5RFS0_9PEZI|nr:hypothetical protein MKZ38_000060 [Zalerion maritima]
MRHPPEHGSPKDASHGVFPGLRTSSDKVTGKTLLFPHSAALVPPPTNRISDKQKEIPRNPTTAAAFWLLSQAEGISQPITVEVVSVEDFSRRQELNKRPTVTEVCEPWTTPGRTTPAVSPVPLPTGESEESLHQGLWNKILRIRKRSGGDTNERWSSGYVTISNSAGNEKHGGNVAVSAADPPSTSSSSEDMEGRRALSPKERLKEKRSFKDKFRSHSACQETHPDANIQSFPSSSTTPALVAQAPFISASPKQETESRKSLIPSHAAFDFEMIGQGFSSRFSVMSRLNTPRFSTTNSIEEGGEDTNKDLDGGNSTNDNDSGEETRHLHTLSYPSPKGSVSGPSGKPYRPPPLKTAFTSSPSRRFPVGQITCSSASTTNTPTTQTSPTTMRGRTPCTPTDLDIHPALRGTNWSPSSTLRTTDTTPVAAPEPVQLDPGLAEVVNDYQIFIAAAQADEQTTRPPHWRWRPFSHEEHEGNRENIDSMLTPAAQVQSSFGTAPGSRISGGLTRRVTASELAEIAENPDPTAGSTGVGPESPTSVVSARTMGRRLGDNTPWSNWNNAQGSSLSRTETLGRRGRSNHSIPFSGGKDERKRISGVSLGAIGGEGFRRQRPLSEASLGVISCDSASTGTEEANLGTFSQPLISNRASASQDGDKHPEADGSKAAKTSGVPIPAMANHASGVSWGDEYGYKAEVEGGRRASTQSRRHSGLSHKIVELVRNGRSPAPYATSSPR